MATAALPSYQKAAMVLEKDKGSGLKLAGWTVARTLLLAPPMMMVGLPTKQAFIGSAMSSALISSLAFLRIFDTKPDSEASLPTYRTAAKVLSNEKGSGLRMAGWTVARTLLIAPPMMIVGATAKQAFLGAGIASAMISILTLLRIFDARETGLAGLKRRLPRASARRQLAGARRR